jgi:hypothetical protein
MKSQGNTLLPDNPYLRAQVLQCTIDVRYLIIYSYLPFSFIVASIAKVWE